MKRTYATPLFTIIALLFSLQTLLFAASPGYTSESAKAKRLATLRVQNKRKVDEITNAILTQIKRQRLEWENKYFVYTFKHDGNSGRLVVDTCQLRDEFSAGNNDGPQDSEGGFRSQQDQNNNRKKCIDEKLVEPFEVDMEALFDYLQEKFTNGKTIAERFAESSGPFPIVDIRSKIELQEAAFKFVDAQFNRSIEEMLEEEKRLVEEEYPLYQENDIVEFSFSPREGVARRTYRGAFRRVGRFKITIGKDFLSMDELPEKIRARFDPELNRIARETMMARHPIISRYNLDREEAISAKVNEWLLNQFENNLPKGWVYIDDAWKMPEDMVDDVIEYRASIGWFYAMKQLNVCPPAQDMISYLKGIGETPDIK